MLILLLKEMMLYNLVVKDLMLILMLKEMMLYNLVEGSDADSYATENDAV